MVKSSIYFYLFNIETFKFNLDETLRNFCAFADEVVCATIPDSDGSYEKLKAKESEFPNFKVILSDIKLTDNRFDGKLKTVALKATTNPIKIIADADERFLLSQKALWQQYYEALLQNNRIDGFLVPVIDLWGSKSKIRLINEIGQKFRLHKSTVVARGVIPQAERADGKFDTSKSDSTEPLDLNGELANFASVASYSNLIPMFSQSLIDKPYVVHLGYLDFNNRIKLNKEFWAEKWSDRSGEKENVVTELLELENQQTIDHNLPLE